MIYRVIKRIRHYPNQLFFDSFWCPPLARRFSTLALKFGNNICVFKSVPHNNDYYCNLSEPLINDSGNGQVGDLHPAARFFAAVAGLFAEI